MSEASPGPPTEARGPFGGAGVGDPRGPAVLLALFGLAGAALLWPMLAPFPGTAHNYLAAIRTAPGVPLLVGGFALAGSGLALNAVVTRLTRAAQSVAGGDYGAVARSASTVCAAIIGASAAALAEPAAVRTLGGLPTGAPDLAPRLGFVLLTVPAMVAAAVAVSGTAFAVWRAGRIGTQLAVLGFAAAACLLFGLLVFPILALPAWLLAAAFRVGGRSAGGVVP